MCRTGRILLMTAGLFLAVAAMVIAGFTNPVLPDLFYMTVCLGGLAMVYFSSRGLSGKR